MIDWAALGEETIEILRRYLAIDTTNPPFVVDPAGWTRVHGTDERISLENLRAGARSYTELLLAVAAA